jgi:hypothetical protein
MSIFKSNFERRHSQPLALAAFEIPGPFLTHATPELPFRSSTALNNVAKVKTRLQNFRGLSSYKTRIPPAANWRNSGFIKTANS